MIGAGYPAPTLKKMKIAIAQINQTAGDINGNLKKMLMEISRVEDLSSLPDISIISSLTG